MPVSDRVPDRLKDIFRYKLQCWDLNAARCDPIDKAKASKLIAEFYEVAYSEDYNRQLRRKPCPPILYLSSPRKCVDLIEAADLSRRGESGAADCLDRLAPEERDALAACLGVTAGCHPGTTLNQPIFDQLCRMIGRPLLVGSLTDTFHFENTARDYFHLPRIDDQSSFPEPDWQENAFRRTIWSELYHHLLKIIGSTRQDKPRHGDGCVEFCLRNCCHFGQHIRLYADFLTYDALRCVGVPYSPYQNWVIDLWIRQAVVLHWWFPFEDLVLASERHTHVLVDDQYRLHHPDRKAIEYSDGWGLHAWHGLTERFLHDPPEILKEENIERRRAMIEQYDEKNGKGRFLIDCGAKVIDSAVQPMRPGQPDSINELLSLELPGDPDGRMVALKVIDPSTGREYILRVPPYHTKVQQALAWTFDLTAKDYTLEQET
jgi:hypothetical protein